MQSVPDGVQGAGFWLVHHGWRVARQSLPLDRRRGGAAHGRGGAGPASYFTLYGVLAGMILLSLLGLPCLHAIRKREHLDVVAATTSK